MYIFLIFNIHECIEYTYTLRNLCVWKIFDLREDFGAFSCKKARSLDQRGKHVADWLLVQHWWDITTGVGGPGYTIADTPSVRTLTSSVIAHEAHSRGVPWFTSRLGPDIGALFNSALSLVDIRYRSLDDVIVNTIVEISTDRYLGWAENKF